MMTHFDGYLVLAVGLIYVTEFQGHAKVVDIHGGVPMGVLNDKCDNAQVNLTVDWDDSTDFDYACQPDEHMLGAGVARSRVECQPKEEQPQPIHYCMNRSIEYNDYPPRAGPHRPIWPVYGEYTYCPPQRWIHTMEHGSAVFLHHPCADPEQVALLRDVAASCIHRRIFTPYRGMPEDRPFAVVTYGCRLSMSFVDVPAIKNYIRRFAINPNFATETGVYRNGQYTKGLISRANIVSDEQDSELCPERGQYYPDLEMRDYELMDLLNKLEAGK